VVFLFMNYFFQIIREKVVKRKNNEHSTQNTLIAILLIVNLLYNHSSIIKNKQINIDPVL
jgi:hypothetical protein